MSSSPKISKNVRTKNWTLFAIIVALMILLYALSFVRFAEVVYA